jgi:hypothetical protein
MDTMDLRRLDRWIKLVCGVAAVHPLLCNWAAFIMRLPFVRGS